jgi:ditrans,polycis-polyprenyl diphosphate synthase
MINYVGDKISSLLKKITSTVISIGGQVPKSIAIIMDGNRRYAQQKKVEKIKGHEDGLSKLLQVVSWCLDFQIKELTVFAFSIDNFNRPKEEIDALMLLAKEKFAVLSEKNEYLQRYGVKICFYGNLSYLGEELNECFLKMMKDTEKNNLIKLNVCFPYNFNEEIYGSVMRIIENELPKSRNELEAGFYGGCNCSPDILIRTSGEIRLSNFLLYQTRFSMLFFIQKFWPDFNYFDFMQILIRYNINYKSHLRNIKELEEKNSMLIKEFD